LDLSTHHEVNTVRNQTAISLALVTGLSFGLGSTSAAENAGVASVKTYLLERLNLQKAGTAKLEAAADKYLALAKAVNFDYTKLATQSETVRAALRDARTNWSKASPVYESIEGIVAGVEMLASFDVNLDAGTSKVEGGDTVVEFDLKLANGKTLERPGNAFGVNEGALWGTEKTFSSSVKFDVDGDGKIGFGDQLPDAYVLKAAADKLDSLTQELIETSKKWSPSSSDVFGALAANVPTVAPVFIDRWKTSRFILGDKATRRDFNVISSLNDLSGNISSWQRLYTGVSPSVKAKNASLDQQIMDGLSGLKSWTAKLEAQESTRRFTPEQAEAILKEGDNRATAITGKITQAAALLGVKVGN
jgi:Imelysin